MFIASKNLFRIPNYKHLRFDNDVITKLFLCDLIHQKWTIHIVATIVFFWQWPQEVCWKRKMFELSVLYVMFEKYKTAIETTIPVVVAWLGVVSRLLVNVVLKVIGLCYCFSTDYSAQLSLLVRQLSFPAH